MNLFRDLSGMFLFLRQASPGARLPLASLILTSAGFSVFSALSISLLLPFVNLLFMESSPVVTAWPVLREERLASLIVVCLLTWLFFFIKNILFAVSGRLRSRFKTNVASEIRMRLMDSLAQRSFEELRTTRSGPMMERLFDGSGQLAEKSAAIVSGVARDGVLVLAYLSILFWLNPLLMALSLMLAPLVSLAGHRMARRLRSMSERRIVAVSDFLYHVQQRMSAMKLIRLLHGEAFERSRFERTNSELADVERRRETFEAIAMAFTEMAGVSAGLLLLYILGQQTLSGTFVHGPGGLVLFVAAVFSLIDPMRHLLQVRPVLAECLLNAERLAAACTVTKTVVPNVRHTSFAGEIIWKSVGFGYKDSGHAILRDVNAVLRKGEWIGLSGPSGIGKTTLVDLTLGLYPPQSGLVTLDGIPVHTIDPQDRSRLFGILTQDAYIFPDTIRHNVVYNLPAVAEDRIMRMLEMVQLGEWIQRKAHGLDEKLGEHGLGMSGGEKQRLAMARMLLREPELLILDEATSALDAATEHAILEMIKTHFGDRTVILVSHRTSVLAFARRRLAIASGNLVERQPA